MNFFWKRYTLSAELDPWAALTLEYFYISDMAARDQGDIYFIKLDGLFFAGKMQVIWYSLVSLGKQNWMF